jgi:2'-5' RNA ligase
MRTFLAIDLPADGREIVRRLQQPFERAGGLELTKPEQCHLTLKFLGEADERLVESFAMALGEVRVERFELAFTSLGSFPNASRPRVIWLGLSELPALQRLAAAVDRATSAVPLDKPFRAHVTLARARERGARLDADLLAARVPPFEFQVGEFVLYQSVLGHAGPRYTALRRFELTAAS